MSEHYDLSDLCASIKHEVMSDLHTSMPAKVVLYSPEKQTGIFRPMVQRVYWSNEVVNGVPAGEKIYQAFADLHDVPVCFPGGSDFTVTWPLAPGDDVILIFSEASLDQYMQFGAFGGEDGTGLAGPQVDVSRHSLGFAVAVPVRFPYGSQVNAGNVSTDATTVGNAAMMLGKANGTQVVIDDVGGTITLTKGTGAAYAALAPATDTNFATIATALQAGIATLTGSGPATIAQVTVALTAIKSALTFPSVAASVVKVK